MEESADIVIVGGGAAGLSAATAAAEKGAKVCLLEANAAVGGNGLFPRGIFAVNSPVQKQNLIISDSDDIFKRCMEYSHWKIDGDIIRNLIEKSGDTIAWLQGKGVEFTQVVHHLPNQTPEVFHITGIKVNTGQAVVKALKGFIADKGVTIHTHTQGKKLVIDNDGAVSGVIAETKEGKQITVRAGKVILATGGFAGNPELIKKYYPKFRPDVVRVGHGMQHNGDGISMAQEAGAGIEGNFSMEIAAPKIKGYEALNLLLGKPWNIWINRLGKRFASESIVYDFTMAANACLRQPDGKVWVLFDSSCKGRTLAEGRDMIEVIHIPADAEERLENTIKEACDNGIMKVSESLDEIAGFIGCPPETLNESITQYNEFCRTNRDAKYAKDRGYLQALDTPPYYAIKAGADMIITHGGVLVNDKFQALRDDFTVIPNLYIAGVDFGGADSDVYNVTMSGHGFGFAVNSGRMAGENSAGSL